MELDLGQNGARSRIDHYLCFMGFFFFFFSLLGCGFDNDLIMVGLWVMACGGGAKLWVLIVVVVEWVAMLHGFQFFFFFFLVVGFI